MTGIVYVIRNGLQWKDAPKAYGPLLAYIASSSVINQKDKLESEIMECPFTTSSHLRGNGCLNNDQKEPLIAHHAHCHFFI
ncbi:hypothetical protein S1001342_03028 (plasmid) [Acetobacter pasteurianus subsp. pasteurianus]|uniref:Transposase n=1 Tax=Acetobacter pasteurianus subsp. pasteurianus TaxID=481145 RepID=A0A1Y0Y279_ACEPA|nr:hypothetical protein S1001342_03028 [Acetobacter pasteurianus subsp. pasteurianus]